MTEGSAVETSRRILVVEDDPVIREVLVDALGQDGYDVRAAADGLEALGELEIWAPDLLILDLMMPRMDAWQFRSEQRRRALQTTVPILILSAGRELQSRTTDLSPSAVLAKPFDLDTLLNLVDDMLRGGGNR